VLYDFVDLLICPFFFRPSAFELLALCGVKYIVSLLPSGISIFWRNGYQVVCE